MDSTTSTTPLCIDCAHFLPGRYVDPQARIDLARCARSTRLLNPVDGSETPRFCENERHASGECGPQGAHFQPADIGITP